MFTVVSLRAEDRFKSANAIVPAGLNIIHVAATDEDTVAEACSEADFILGALTKVTARVIERAKKVKLIQMAAAGYDFIDIEAAARAGIPVANAPNTNNSTVAEYVFAAAMIIERRILESDVGIKSGNYAQTRARTADAGMFELKGKTLGIIGLGRIGREVAKRALAFEMHTLYYDIVRPTSEEEQRMGVKFVPFEELLCSSDIVTLHVPLTPLTGNMIGEKELSLLKPNALMINAARGGVVNEAALVDALKEGKIGGAAVDVFTQEPLPTQHPFLGLPAEVSNRLLLTPHVAGVTRESLRRMMQTALDNIARVARGEKPLYVVNGVG